jgi:threonine 3-dehydrogenase
MGIPAQKVELEMAEDMIFKGLEVKCIVGRRLYQTWDTMKALLDGGKLDVSPAITHHLSFEDYDHGMQLMREGLCGKVIFRL